MQWRERRFKVSRNLQGAVNEHLLCKTCSVSTQIRLFNPSKAVTFVLLNIQRRWQRFTVTRVTKPAVTLEALSGICFNCSLTLVRLIFIALWLRLWPLSTTWLPFHLEDLSDLNLSFPFFLSFLFLPSWKAILPLKLSFLLDPTTFSSTYWRQQQTLAVGLQRIL